MSPRTSYLREAFVQHGCKLRALNDRGGDSPEGQLTDGILDQIARFERLKIAEGTVSVGIFAASTCNTWVSVTAAPRRSAYRHASLCRA